MITNNTEENPENLCKGKKSKDNIFENQ